MTRPLFKALDAALAVAVLSQLGWLTDARPAHTAAVFGMGFLLVVALLGERLDRAGYFGGRA
ncbi:hypothetical protein [Sphingobium sp. WCS2017Hpa-17]|uniref:hypothetical protein n=1 Tax=Sphingobium sp. WCS2017Hpa-17 TaxID=3073638 RepID=UPI00288A0D6E|nr:hypothetical protein [Sphingobium sp. WCS2017Hpa-17]